MDAYTGTLDDRFAYGNLFRDGMRLLRDNFGLWFWAACVVEELSPDTAGRPAGSRFRDCIFDHVSGRRRTYFTLVDDMASSASTFSYGGRENCLGGVGVIYKVDKKVLAAYQSPDPDLSFQAVAAMSSYILHEMVHMCDFERARHVDPGCWHEPIMLWNTYQWAMAKRYPNCIGVPNSCTAAWSNDIYFLSSVLEYHTWDHRLC